MKSVMCVRECEIVYRRRQVPKVSRVLSTSRDVYSFVCSFDAHLRAAESIWSILIDARLKAVAVHEVGRGSISAVPVTLADLFRAAIIAAVPGLILVHNHPSADAAPSSDDLEMTRRAIEAGRLLGVRVLDHVIVTPDSYAGLRDSHTSLGWEAE